MFMNLFIGVISLSLFVSMTRLIIKGLVIFADGLSDSYLDVCKNIHGLNKERER